MKRQLICLLGAMIAASASPGCISRLAKEGVGVVRGAKGIYASIAPDPALSGAKPLSRYRRFELGPISDDFGGKVPPRLLELLPTKFREHLAEAGLPHQPDGKTLLIRGRIVHYEAEGMLGLTFGDFEEVIARVEFVDKASGKVIGEANCIGRSNESVNRGVETKADGLAKAIVKWIADRYPE